MQHEFPRGYFDHNHDYPSVLPARPKEEFPPPDLDHCHKYYTSIVTVEGGSVTDTVIVPLQPTVRRRGPTGSGARGIGAVTGQDHDDDDDEVLDIETDDGDTHDDGDDFEEDDDDDDDDGGHDIDDEEDHDDAAMQVDDSIISTNHRCDPRHVEDPTSQRSNRPFIQPQHRAPLHAHDAPSISVMAQPTSHSPPRSGSRTTSSRLSPANYAYWLQRELREAIYGSVWQGQILERMPSADGSLRWKATCQKVAVKIMDFQKIMEQDSHSAERPLQEIAAMQHLQRFISRRQYGSGGSGGRVGIPSGVGGVSVGWQSMDMGGSEGGCGEEVQQRLKREMAIQGMMEHHVMTFIDVLTDDSELYLVMPFCSGGELFDVLEERKTFPESEARFWMKQILKGIETMQKAGMCHRDMSLENILTTSDNVALIIDFGMSIRIPYLDTTATTNGGVRQRCLIKPDRPCGKPYYCSPEIVRSRQPFDGHAVDIWALGPLLFLMVCGFPPWENATPTDERFSAFSNGQFAAIARHWNLGLSPDLEDLLQRLFWVNPMDRLSLEQLKNHPWMSGPETRPPQHER